MVHIKRIFAPHFTLMLSLGCLIIGTAQVTYADTLKIPLGQQGQALGIQSPKLGMSKSQVLAQYGQPSQKSGPVGKPAIYTWQYEQFDVYFEGDHVIHSVVRHVPEQSLSE
jgi:hypothetical protein